MIAAQRSADERLATGRDASAFSNDLAAQAEAINEVFADARVLVIGAAGTIGSAVALQALQSPARAVDLVDVAENGLVEIVRDALGRGRAGGPSMRSFGIDFGSPSMAALLRAEEPYDLIFNLAAVKHVRAERDPYSLLHLLETNVVKQRRFLGWLAAYGPEARYFSVSTDKAANPTSIMGASKRLMEAAMFEGAHGFEGHIASARFANVAFSSGSLPDAWRARLKKRQPIAAPRDARRYFIDSIEAAELCLLGATVAPSRSVVAPSASLRLPLVSMADLAARFLRAHGWEPRSFDNEAAAIEAVEPLAAEGAWPLLLTPLDTSGEKPYEEFVGAGDRILDTGLTSVDMIEPANLGRDAIEEFVAAYDAVASAPRLKKSALVSWISAAVPTLRHAETGRNLDERL